METLGPRPLPDLGLTRGEIHEARTQEEIAEKEHLTHQAVDLILEEMAGLPKLLKSEQALAAHATDFEPPIYNIWKQQRRHDGSKSCPWATFESREGKGVGSVVGLLK